MSKGKYAIAVIALIALVGVFNYAINMDPTQLAARGVGRDPHEHHHDEEAEEQELLTEPPDPIGVEDAPVQIEVFYEDDNQCMMGFAPLMTEIGEQYAPHVRVVFKPTHLPENHRRSDELGLGCASGLAMNGEVVKKVPGLGRFNLVSFRGPPGMKDYNEKALRKAVEHELKIKGVEFTPPSVEQESREAEESDEEHSHEHH